ncbi:MAG: C25 family cysteine peptidase [bacterium]
MVSCHSSLAASGEPLFQVIEATDSYVVFSIRPLAIKLEPVLSGNRKFQRVLADGYAMSTETGAPQLPQTGTLIQIPAGAEVSLTVLASAFESVTDVDVAPASDILFEENLKGMTESYVPNPAIYNSDSFWPAQLAGLSERAVWRGREVIRVQVNPVQYNPAQKTVRFYTALTLRVSFSRSFAGSPSAKTPPGIFDRLIGRSLLNPRKGFRTKAAKRETDVRTTLDPLAAHYKMLIEQEGIYALSYDDLVHAGVDPNGIDLSTLKIINKGKEIPLWIEGPQGATFGPGNVLYFYADRYRGQDRFFDLYTDTNVYWLTSGGEPGKRYRLMGETPGSAENAPYYWETVHIEKDSLFYRWNGSSTLDPGEGWIWRYFFDNEREVFDFNVSGVFKQVETCTLRIRLRGTTLDPVNPDHHVRLSINNQIVDDAFFDDRDELLWQLSIPTRILQDGANRFDLQLIPVAGTSINQIYLDWVEIIYPRVHAVQKSQLKFKASNETTTITAYSAVNFEDEKILIFEPGRAKMWQPAPEKLSFYRVESAGFDDGDFTRISADFKAYHFGTRGHNLVVIDTQTGDAESRNFDTYASTDQADAMADYIHSLPAGAIVLAGIRDEGSRNMTETAYQALESLGSSLSRQVADRDSWAFIGWKGAPPDSVKEVISNRFDGSAVLSDTMRHERAFRYRVTFTDTSSSEHFYYGVSGRGLRRVTQIIADRKSDLRATTQGADYLIITHANFAQSALELARYRTEHDGFRSTVVEVQDVYDEFSDGIIDPLAIKKFLTYTFLNWQQPAPSFVLLFGDASWDPKKHLGPTSKVNFVPTYGDPVSDNWFVTLDGEDDALPDMFIGRIPVETPEQAEIVVNKIISYEQQPFASWNKEFLFFNGGINSTEQSIFRSQSQNLISRYLDAPPLIARATNINKTTDEAITVSLKHIATERISQGALWVNFLGHGGSAVWDISIGQPEDWQNSEIFPFMTGMSCHSARFANPSLNSLSELYVLNEMGAAAYWGSTGFGFVTQDFFLLDGLFSAVTRENVRRIAEATTLAKISVWRQLGPQTRNRMVVDQYTLIGDPALNLALSKKPELAVQSGEIKFDADFLLIEDSTATVSALIRNHGMVPEDSTEVQFTVFDSEGEGQPLGLITVPPVGLTDSLTVVWNIPKTPGLYRVQVQVDPFNRIAEDDKLNNTAENEIPVYSSELSLLKPFEFAVVSEPQIELVTNNSRSAVEDLTYSFELDTSAQFNTPFLMQSPAISEGLLVTKWRTNITPGVYYWRVRTFDGAHFTRWVRSSFSYVPEETSRWQQSKKSQFDENSISGIDLLPSHRAVLAQRQLVYRAESAGLLDGNFALLSLNGDVAGQNLRGHNLAVFDQAHGRLLSNPSFDTYIDPANAEAMAEFINGLPEGRIVLAAIRDEGSVSMTENAYVALESIGSALTRQVGVRDSWAIIGRKGAAMGTVPEILSRSGNGVVSVSDTLFRLEKSGKMTSPEIGPALKWRTLTLDVVEMPPKSHAEFKVLGNNKNSGRVDTLKTASTTQKQVDLQDIDPQTYPEIRLLAQLLSQDGLESPELHAWGVDFDPAADVVVGQRAVTVVSDTVQQGDDAQVEIRVGNFGFTPVDSLAIDFSAPDVRAGTIVLDRIHAESIAVDQVVTLQASIPTDNLSGKIDVTASLDPEDKITEVYESNNAARFSIWVVKDTLSPTVRLTFDGRTLGEGEFVSQKPEIVAELRDSGSQSFADTSGIVMLLDGQKVTYGNEPAQAVFWPQERQDDPALKAVVIFKPELQEGEHVLEMLIEDASGNIAYTQTGFLVSSDFIFTNVMNYPNPFHDRTKFTYVLTQEAEEIRLKIYTIAGRLIYEDDFLPAGVGFNQFEWDGRDEAGDTLANGVYLYKLIARRGEAHAEVVEKFVVVR